MGRRPRTIRNSGGKCKVSWPIVTNKSSKIGLGILDLHRFSRALRLRWLWLAFTNPDRVRKGMGNCPSINTDRALFAAATRSSGHERPSGMFLVFELDAVSDSK